MTMLDRPAESANTSSVEMMELLRGIWRRKFLILSLAIIFGAVAAFFVLRAKPSYTVEARVLIDNLETSFSRADVTEQNSAQRQFDERDIASQVAVIGSRDLAMRVIDDLKLAGQDEFDPMKQGVGTIGRLLILLGFRQDPAPKSLEQRAYDRFDSMLTVYPVPESKVIALRYTANDPGIAADAANRLAEIFVMSTRETQSEPTGRAREWLAQQIDILRKRVAESESAAETFRAKAGLIKGKEAMLGTEGLSELSTQITLAESARTEAQAKARAIRDLLENSGSVDASPDVLNSTLIQRLREQQVALERNLAELTVTYLSGHPKVIAVRNEIANVDRQIRREAMRIVEGLEDQAKISASREAAARASLAAAKAEASGNNQDEVELRALEREAAANRQLLETYLNRYADASSRQEIIAQPGYARIIQRADRPAVPTAPLVGPTIMIAALAGLAVGLGLAFLAEVMAMAGRAGGAAVRRQEPVMAPAMPPPQPQVQVQKPLVAEQPPPKQTVEKAAPVEPPPPPISKERQAAAIATTQPPLAERQPIVQPPPPLEVSDAVPALSEVPATHDLEQAYLHGRAPVTDSASSYATAISLVASWSENVRQSLGVQRLAVAGLGHTGPDTAAAAAALARALAMQGVSTLIVDAASHYPAIHTVFGIDDGQGLSDILLGQAQIDTIIRRDSVTSAHVLRAGSEPGELADLINSPRMDALLDAFGQVYSVVIIHCGDAANGARAMVRRCHGAILVAGGSSLVDAARLIEQWRQSGLRAVQFVRVDNRMRRAA
jgi:polysaccharide biosynthesis transport protein